MVWLIIGLIISFGFATSIAVAFYEGRESWDGFFATMAVVGLITFLILRSGYTWVRDNWPESSRTSARSEQVAETTTTTKEKTGSFQRADSDTLCVYLSTFVDEDRDGWGDCQITKASAKKAIVVSDPWVIYDYVGNKAVLQCNITSIYPETAPHSVELVLAFRKRGSEDYEDRFVRFEVRNLIYGKPEPCSGAFWYEDLYSLPRNAGDWYAETEIDVLLTELWLGGDSYEASVEDAVKVDIDE